MAQSQTKTLTIADAKAQAKAADAVLEQMFAYYDRVEIKDDSATGHDIRHAA
ncbi:hypothetical protein JJJ17_03865 [Paracoccus caeni]|uniref:Uncharacterized protein n=1 Tax=Paracoccus caeni TaxID=657651 RepID=A0A934SH26_9RHOB|nr:hypothetical protein [Paracoccus caeni]MBK4215059.1 hypothetical protein [Paracoccus caeni]